MNALIFFGTFAGAYLLFLPWIKWHGWKERCRVYQEHAKRLQEIIDQYVKL